MSDEMGLVERLNEEAERLSGHSIDRGSVDAGIASNLASEAAAAIERLVAERDEARVYARNFLISFVNRYCDPIEGWAPLPDLIGMLTQIDNASTVAGDFRRRAQNAEAQRDKLKGALTDILHWDEEYRASMSPEVEKDPVTLACDRARQALKATP